MPLRKKLALAALLCSGLVVISAAMVRVTMSLKHHPSALSINRWGVRETIAGVVAVNLPILSPRKYLLDVPHCHGACADCLAVFVKSFWTGDVFGVRKHASFESQSGMLTTSKSRSPVSPPSPETSRDPMQANAGKKTDSSATYPGYDLELGTPLPDDGKELSVRPYDAHEAESDASAAQRNITIERTVEVRPGSVDGSRASPGEAGGSRQDRPPRRDYWNAVWKTGRFGSSADCRAV